MQRAEGESADFYAPIHMFSRVYDSTDPAAVLRRSAALPTGPDVFSEARTRVSTPLYTCPADFNRESLGDL